MADKIIKLADHDDRAITASVSDVINMTKDVIDENSQYKKALIILLDDEGDAYNTKLLCAGIGRATEVISLLEVEKQRQLRDLDII